MASLPSIPHVITKHRGRWEYSPAWTGRPRDVYFPVPRIYNYRPLSPSRQTRRRWRAPAVRGEVARMRRVDEDGLHAGKAARRACRVRVTRCPVARKPLG